MNLYIEKDHSKIKKFLDANEFDVLECIQEFLIYAAEGVNAPDFVKFLIRVGSFQDDFYEFKIGPWTLSIYT